jgi:1-deoxy-D-xylulose-5-phosphate reductoisomerase
VGLLNLIEQEADIVVAAMTGMKALAPVLKAIEMGRTILIANKELLVSAGALITAKAQAHQASMIPIDSEHTALFHLSNHQSNKDIENLYLTASGGPFFRYNEQQLSAVTKEQALQHPNWVMGAKNTIDSSTMMNKGLEVIEAYWLFNLAIDQIKVVVHPQSIVHAMIGWRDGSYTAHMSSPSMLQPISYALHYPKMPHKSMIDPLPFDQSFHLEFLPPPMDRFPCLKLAYEAVKIGQSMPCFMNSANTALVDRLIHGEIQWIELPMLLEELMSKHQTYSVSSLEEIIEIDQEAMQKAKEIHLPVHA